MLQHFIPHILRISEITETGSGSAEGCAKQTNHTDAECSVHRDDWFTAPHIPFRGLEGVLALDGPLPGLLPLPRVDVQDVDVTGHHARHGFGFHGLAFWFFF